MLERQGLGAHTRIQCKCAVGRSLRPLVPDLLPFNQTHGIIIDSPPGEPFRLLTRRTSRRSGRTCNRRRGAVRGDPRLDRSALRGGRGDPGKGRELPDQRVLDQSQAGPDGRQEQRRVAVRRLRRDQGREEVRAYDRASTAGRGRPAPMDRGQRADRVRPHLPAEAHRNREAGGRPRQDRQVVHVSRSHLPPRHPLRGHRQRVPLRAMPAHRPHGRRPLARHLVRGV